MPPVTAPAAPGVFRKYMYSMRSLGGVSGVRRYKRLGGGISDGELGGREGAWCVVRRTWAISLQRSVKSRVLCKSVRPLLALSLGCLTHLLLFKLNRTSRSGDVIGPDRRVNAYVALKSMTDWAAYQLFEEDRKGTLTAGKLADLVIVDRDPLAVDQPSSRISESSRPSRPVRQSIAANSDWRIQREQTASLVRPARWVVRGSPRRPWGRVVEGARQTSVFPDFHQRGCHDPPGSCGASAGHWAKPLSVQGV